MDYRFRIASRYLFSPRRLSVISVITGVSVAGITLGVAALVVVLSVMNGFYDVVRDLMVSVDPHVRIVAADARGVDAPDSLIALSLSIPHVTAAEPYAEGKALLSLTSQAEGARVIVVRGVAPNALGSDLPRGHPDEPLSLAEENGTPGVLIGANLATQLAVSPRNDVGLPSTIRLLSAENIAQLVGQPFPVLPRTQFQVRDVYRVDGGAEEPTAFVALEEAQRLFRLGDRVSGVELRVDDLDRAADVKRTLQARLDPARFDVRTWYDLQKSLYVTMQLEKLVASLILGLIMIVAAFSIVGSLMMVVTEKRRDIGVLMTMGVSARNIRRIFLMEGLLIAAIGGGLGLALGLGLAWAQGQFGLVPLPNAEQFIIDAYPVAIQWEDVLLVSGVAAMLCVVAAVYPAMRAAAVEPTRAIHGYV